jgi:2,4-dienoyl-CoA reductase-like NADH-dependent reductase (Old Yellow Enzyme family)
MPEIESVIGEPKEIGGIIVKNRLVRSATFEGMAKDGYVTDEFVKLYKTLAEGGVGLIITGYAYVQRSGQSYLSMTGIDRDDLIPGLKTVAATVHEHGDGCKIAMQLAHCGRQSNILETPVAPSAVFDPWTNKMPREMTLKEIEETIEAFAEAAVRAKKAGFDAVQIHAAHGYLLNQFLSPYTNKRTDEYGGNTEKRIRIIEDVFNTTVEKVGKSFPILIKMNVDDFLEGGINLEESKRIVSLLSKLRFAAIEISGGMWETRVKNKDLATIRTGIRSREKEAYFLPYAKEIRKVTDIPLILVGGIRSLGVAQKILAEGSADFVSLCRPLIRQPGLPKKWLKGTGELTADCISCNACLDNVAKVGVRCIQKERTEQKTAS